MCPFAVPLVSSTSSRLINCGGWILRSSWTSTRVTSRVGPPLWLYCCFSFWIVLSVREKQLYHKALQRKKNQIVKNVTIFLFSHQTPKMDMVWLPGQQQSYRSMLWIPSVDLPRSRRLLQLGGCCGTHSCRIHPLKRWSWTGKTRKSVN